MVIYSVSIIIKHHIEEEWFKWMSKTHIPNVMKTGLFNNYKIYKNVFPTSELNETTYTVQYECASMEDYLTYKEKYAAALQRQHGDKFAGKVATARVVMQEVD